MPAFDTLRARSFLFRLPLFTRAVLVLITVLAVLSLQSFWDVEQWGALIPSQVSLLKAYRISTFPLVHTNLIHALLNIVALAPLLERFESEHGTLTTLSLFFGPLTTIPAVSYLLIESFILRGDVAVAGASIWVFLLLGIEAIRTYRSNPYLVVATHQIPTWITPLVLIVIVAVLVPSASFLGHLCGVAIGYLFGLGYLKFLQPPEGPLRWVESRLNLLGRLPHYVSVDQKTYGRFGILPTTGHSGTATAPTFKGSGQRLGP